MSDPRDLGRTIAQYRRQLKLSQTEFGSLIGRSESWVSQVERGVRSLDRLSLLQTVADALGVSVAELQGHADAEEDRLTERPEAFETLRLSLTGHPAVRAVLAHEDRQYSARDVDGMDQRRAAVWPLVHGSKYNDLAPVLASLIPDLELAVRLAETEPLRRRAREILVDVYQATAAMMAKLSENDAAWIAADRAAHLAESLDLPLQAAASLYRMALVFLSLRQVSQAQKVAVTTSKALMLRMGDNPEPEELSLYGAFQLVLSVASARENERTQAYEHLADAQRTADRIGTDRNDFGTEFGPTNVAIHAVSVAVEVGDAGLAIQQAREVDPSHLSNERQARFAIDLAAAHAMRRQTGEALRELERAEALAPEQTRTHRIARDVARDLIQLAGSRPPRPELRDLAERFGVHP
jgi:transcriptional regulator with XRE-family HTH domain